MKYKTIFYLIISLLWLLTSCSGGSSSGGGSTNTQTTSTSTPTTVIYSKTDLAGTWRWLAKRQTNSDTLSGTITFDNNVRMIGFSPDRCPGGQSLPNSEFWLYDYGFVKGHFYNFCGDPTAEVKFGVYFSPDKKSMTGIMDLHYLVDSSETYDRFDITWTKQ
jgi:hypothetical protein